MKDRVGEKFLICRRKVRLLKKTHRLFDAVSRRYARRMGINPTPTLAERRPLPMASLANFLFSRQGAKDAKVPLRTLLFFSLRILCGLCGFAGDYVSEDKSLKFRVFDGRRAVGLEYGENEAK